MATVAVLVNGARAEARRLAAEVGPWLEARGHHGRVLQLGEADRAAGHVPAGDLSDANLAGADLAVSLGGDGTFLRMVPLAYAAKIPVLGVNFGRLGYLLEVAPARFWDALERTLAGEVTLEERTVLAISVNGALASAAGDDRSLPGDGGERWWIALNEMVAEKTVPGHMVQLSTAIDGEACLSYKADGVLVATPTGSTAYNLSAGGPVISPTMRAMVVTPVAPHLSIDRSLVLQPDQVVTVGVLGGRPAVLVVDGREVGRLSPGAEVVCRVAPDPIRFVTLGERGFAGLLRQTLAPG
ncbi:MAG TPA: NAD(+)/NADH kinase [Acidimicrobiales bacterium]|nr:NAD(+)/NADH kinase [Acidimicrobiales bacterium]